MTEKKGKCQGGAVETTVKVSTDLVIASVVIPQDGDGRYHLNRLHELSGSNDTKNPGQWLKRKTTKALIKELDSRVLFSTLNVVHGGEHSGTYAHELLAVSYAGWVSSSFQLTVNQAFLDMKRGSVAVVAPDPVEKYPELRALREMVVAIAEARDEAMLAREEAREANANAQRALETQVFFTVAEYIYINKLTAQLPVSGYKACSDYLRLYCLDHNIPFRKQPVGGRQWPDEYAYHTHVYVEALPGWLTRRYAQSTLHVLHPS